MQISLPNSTTVDAAKSSCGTDSSSASLVAVFGSGHALGMSFSTNDIVYSVANLTLQYNLSDTSVFPGSNSSGENISCNLLLRLSFLSFVVELAVLVLTITLTPGAILESQSFVQTLSMLNLKLEKLGIFQVHIVR